MDFRHSAIFNALQLPAYWRACHRTRAQMDIRVNTVPYGKHPRQYYLEILPAAVPARPDRHAFYFHGGAWTFGRPETFIPAAIPWLEKGFRVLMPSYRRPPRVWLPDIVDDCRVAISHAAVATDVEALHLGGISAGGHLAALLACHPEWWTSAGWSSTPHKALICAAPTSFEHLWPSALFSRYPTLNPVQQLASPARADLAWYLLHGTADATVSYEHSQVFAEALRRTGHRVQFHTLPGGTHLDAGRWMFGELAEKEVKEFIQEGLRP